MTVSKKMSEAIDRFTEFNFSDYEGVDICTTNDDEVAQAVINAAWIKYDQDDKETWPDGEAYEYICLMKDWNMTGFAIRICGKAWQIDKWDNVVAYIDPKTILPSRDWNFK